MIIGGASIFMITSIIQKNEELKEKMEIQKIIKNVQYKLAGLSNDERGFMITGDRQFAEGMKEESEEVTANLYKSETLIQENVYKEKVETLKQHFADYGDLNQSVLSQYDSDPEKAESLHFGEERTLRKEVLDPSVNSLEERLHSDVEELKEEIHQYGSISKWIMGGNSDCHYLRDCTEYASLKIHFGSTENPQSTT